MALNLTAEDLLKHQSTSGKSYSSELEDNANFNNLKAPMTFADGITAVIDSQSRTFTTSPNRMQIPRPPLGSTRDLYRRDDGFYGQDDPVLCPLPFNPKYSYLACVPVAPSYESDPYYSDFCMWKTLYRTQDFNREGEQSPALREFSQSIETLRQREKKFLGTVSSRILILAVSELQRAWRTAVAVIDFVEVYQPRMMSTDDLTELYQGSAPWDDAIGKRLGAFVWNDKDAMMLYRAKLPVYYVRYFNDFDHQKILHVGSFHDSYVGSVKVASPNFPIIYHGQAGSDDKFAAIRAASISCFNIASPFENLHLPGAYNSSYSLGSGSIISPSTSTLQASQPLGSGPKRAFSGPGSSYPHPKKQKKGKAHQSGSEQTNAPINRDHFADLPDSNDFVLPPIPAWRDANRSINDSHPDKRQMLPGDQPRLKTVLPDPAAIFGTPETARQTSYLAQYAHIRQPLVTRSRDGGGGEIPIPLKTSVWRKVMCVPFHGLYTKPDLDPKNKQARDHLEATEWLQMLFRKYASGADVAASKEASVDPITGRKLVFELCNVNFRYQLMGLDEMVDKSASPPSSSMSGPDLLVWRAQHRRGRLQLIEKVLGGGSGDPFEVSEMPGNIGIACERWSKRFEALRAFWQMMDTWPGKKHVLWNCGSDSNLAYMPAEGEQWEKILVQFYVQTYYNTLNFPPILPRRK
ncbi:hypothetical protein V5O48_012033 [Marasmius crinis-equi]|uniref:Uncharacterized protein n=1 Tax=Marasmius crinis-equi TaxID=585013 RepID=A0ABR3F473_9AGAR